MICDTHGKEWEYLTDDEIKSIHDQAKHLYGLLHSRWITTSPGLSMMKRKSIKKKRYGKCPRVACKGTALLPVGTTHIPNRHCAKLFCPRCADIYQPPEDRRIDGAYFGTEFPAVFLLSYPEYDMRDHFHVFEFQKFGFKIRDPLLTNGPHSKNDYRKNEDE